MSLIPPPINNVSQHVATQPIPAQMPMQMPVNTFVQTAPPKLQIDAESNIEISIEELGSANIKKSVTWKPDEPDVNRVDAELLVLRETINNMTQDFAQLKQLYELSQISITELKDANADLTTKLNHFVEWSQHNIVQLAESNASLATKLNNSVEWSHISIVHLNEANTGLTMKYNELRANQVASVPEPTHAPEPVPAPVPAPIPSPDEIKSTMERILTQMDNE
jgi:hypothetical protein